MAAYPAAVGVYDGQGRLVKQARLTQPGEALDVSALAAGLYVIRVTSPAAVQTQRLVKE